MFDSVCHIVNYLVSSNISNYLQADFFHYLMPPYSTQTQISVCLTCLWNRTVGLKWDFFFFFFFNLFLAALHCMWDLSSFTRGWTHTPCIGSTVCNHWTTGEVVKWDFLLLSFSLQMVCENERTAFVCQDVHIHILAFFGVTFIETEHWQTAQGIDG